MSKTDDLEYRIENLESGMEKLEALAKELGDRVQDVERVIEMQVDSKLSTRLHSLRRAIGAMLNGEPKLAKDALEAFDDF